MVERAGFEHLFNEGAEILYAARVEDWTDPLLLERRRSVQQGCESVSNRSRKF
jgi:hypothetical protein